jgi:two-component system, NtrC family, sensor kinase
MNILIVDDDQFNLKVAVGFLNIISENNNIILCQKPEEVMQLLETENIDILLLDIMMPNISGIDILKSIHSLKSYDDMQIIMLTALTSSESIKECFDLGANDYITKPINIIEFQARFNSVSRTRKSSIIIKEMFERLQLQNNELKEVNARLKDAQFHLVQSGKMAAIGELAAGIAHEINNPIGYVGSNIETLSNYLLKIKEFIIYNQEHLQNSILLSTDNDIKLNIEAILEKYEKMKIERIVKDLDSLINDSKEGINRISEIVQTLRNFARTSIENEMAYNSLEEIINQVLLIVRNESKYAVDIKYEPIEMPGLLCNKGQIGQVLLNIIINAIHAIKSEKKDERGLINIKTYMESEYQCLRINDNGPGIKEEYLSKIFDPFFTTKEVGQGTGLGLSISYDIITKKHNGVLDVKSELGIGTEFLIKLPLKSEKTEVI